MKQLTSNNKELLLNLRSDEILMYQAEKMSKLTFWVNIFFYALFLILIIAMSLEPLYLNVYNFFEPKIFASMLVTFFLLIHLSKLILDYFTKEFRL